MNKMQLACWEKAEQITQNIHLKCEITRNRGYICNAIYEALYEIAVKRVRQEVLPL